MKKLMLIGISVATVYGAFGTANNSSASSNNNHVQNIENVLKKHTSAHIASQAQHVRAELAKKLAGDAKAKRDLIEAMGYQEALEAAQKLLEDLGNWDRYDHTDNVKKNLESLKKIVNALVSGVHCPSDKIKYHYTDSSSGHSVIQHYDYQQKQWQP